MKLNPGALHRKAWEYCLIAQALSERGKLRAGRRGLGFAVGQEPLSALFASLGCEIIATDMPPNSPQNDKWIMSNQYAESLDTLNADGICDAAEFKRLVSFDAVDMRQITDDLADFDFIWSSCALEHLGSIALGQQFVYDAMSCLKPGGIAVHTTEYNVSSDTDTIDNAPNVVLRRCDVEEIVSRLASEGHFVAPIDFCPGTGRADYVVDRPPYTENPHLKLEICGYVCTSLGLIITKS